MKTPLLSAVCSLFAAVALAAESLSFHGVTDRDPLTYALGDEMVFTVTLVDRNAKNAPVPGRPVAWTLKYDDGRAVCGTASSDVPLVVKAKPLRPGFAHLLVRAVDADGRQIPGSGVFDSSAGAEVGRIAATPPPADFDAFWDRELARLASVPMKPVLEEVASKDPAVTVKAFSVNLIPGEGPATGFVAWPTNAAPKSLPIRVDVPGYGYGRVDANVGVAKKGAIVMLITRHGEDPAAPPAYHENLWTNVLQGYGWRNNGTKTANDFARMVMRDVRAVAFAKTLPWWDGRTLTAGGGSMGGYRSIALAALDRDFTHISPGYPAFCDMAGSTLHGRLEGWMPRWTEGLAYADGANLATRVTCPVDLFMGLADFVCPPSGVMVVYRNLRGPVKLRYAQCVGHGCGYGVNMPEWRREKAAAADDGRSRWGGNARGPKRTATGRFRIERVGDARWVVDPDGCLFRDLASTNGADGTVAFRRTPYVYFLRAESRTIGRRPHALRDPFDGAFGECLTWDLAGKRGIPGDPWCLGFCIDTDAALGADPADLARQVLRAQDDQPAKVAFLKRMREKGVAYDPARGADGVPADELKAFGEDVVREYAARTRAAVKKLDAKLLYLGEKFAAPPPAWAEAILRSASDLPVATDLENLRWSADPRRTEAAACDIIHA